MAVQRTMLRFEREADQVVVATLDCGHRRHVRHRPPLERHPWVMSDRECHDRVGQAIECDRCQQRVLPERVVFVRRTRAFDETSVPAGLRANHTTKAGTWGRLQVETGRVRVTFDAPLEQTATATPGQPIIIPPQLPHRVELDGPVRFVVEFLADPGL